MAHLRSLILSVLLFLVSAQVTAQQKKSSKVEIANGMTFYMHTVEKGQTLYSISNLYDVEVTDITAHNDIKDGQLSLGSVIRIPQLESARKQTTRKIISGKDYIMHTVDKGETLYAIGRAYDMKPALIIAENPEAATGISAGQILKIPISSEARSQDKAPQLYAQNAKHTVTQGESLYSIAKEYNVSVSAIVAQNPDCKDGLRTGSVISIPAAPKERGFFYHQVDKGDTFYSISKLYAVNTEELQKDNTAIASGIRPGMFVRIERTPANIKLAKIYPGYSFYEIEKGDTYFSICKKYDIEPKEFKKLNPATDEDALAIGEFVMVPDKGHKFNEKDSLKIKEAPKIVRNGVPFFSCDSLRPDKSRTLNIAMLLPLYLNENDTAAKAGEQNDSRKKPAAAPAQVNVLSKSVPFLAFYEGALLALDTLKKQGYNINVTVYDTEKDTALTKSVLANLNGKPTDLIIGPVFGNTFRVASQYARQHNIPIVSPLSSAIEELNGNPQAMLINTPLQYRIEAASLYFAQDKSSNFIMVHDGSAKDLEIMDMYKKVLLPSISTGAVFADGVFKEINFNAKGIKGVQEALSASEKNIVIIPSQSEGFVNNVVTQLFQYQKRYNINIAGLSQWEQYDNLELDYLFGMNFRFGTGNYIDYNTAEVRDFIKTYRDNFNTEPSKYAFQAYDIMNFYARVLIRYPQFTCECIDAFHYSGLQTSFRMAKLDGGKGIVNTDVTIVQYTPEFVSQPVYFDFQKARKEFESKQKPNKNNSQQELFKK